MYDRKQGRDQACKKRKDKLQEKKKMKKTIAAMLIIAIAAFSCFAEPPTDDGSDNTVLLTGSVAKVWIPSIELQGSKSGTGDWGSSVEVGELKSGGTVYFQILDNTEVNSNTTQTLTVSVTCNPWVGVDDHNETRAITQSIIAPEPAANGVTPSNPGEPADTMKLLLTYDTFNYHKLDNQVVAKFTASWSPDTGASKLGAQNYNASVVISVTAND
jgi:hypothetical protein